MPLRFSDGGPAIPDKLVNGLLDGQVVFLCGAGVSAPQLPTFDRLVDKVYARLGLHETGGEREVRKAGRYEEVLGAVMRRLANPNRLYEEVTGILSLDAPNVEHHKTLLRLSRSRDNRPLLVTTNFESLFERGLDELDGEGHGSGWSLAGQALPPPGSDACHGIVHLHGRIRDAALGLQATPLVLTSAEYGDAYMRSGWASRFLFDLARCKTIVLVGYSANDAPVRYFLNLLEGDRGRFGDLQTVYAFDAYDNDPGEAEARWATVAVTPLAYRKEPEGHPDRYHELWDALGALAELVEQPRLWRFQRAEGYLSKDLAALSEADLEGVDWLFRGRHDLWGVLLKCLKDPAWFDHFSSTGLWSEAEASDVIATWCVAGLQSRDRYETALRVHGKLGKQFAQALRSRLVVKLEALGPPWAMAWKTLVNARSPQGDPVQRNFALAQNLKSAACADWDLQAAVAALTPKIALRPRWRIDGATPDTEAIKTIRDLAYASLSLDDLVYLDELNAALRSIQGRRRRLMQIADSALRTTAACAHDVGLITAEWDALDQGVPSVEVHEQNRHRDGAAQLCELITDLLRMLADEDPVFAKALAETWATLPSVLGYRLLVHALRDRRLFGADEVARHLLALPRYAFWSMRRELVLAMRERLGEAAVDMVEKIVDRILSEREELFAELDIDGAVDWRPQARDHRVWLLLTAIRAGKVLPGAGTKELDEIAGRYPFISGDNTEEDLFASYSYGVRSVEGDPSPVAAALPEQRLETARELRTEFDFTSRLSWSAYCVAEPNAAYEVLRDAPLQRENVGLWVDFLQALEGQFIRNTHSDRDRRYEELLPANFQHLKAATDEFLSELLQPLTSLLSTYSKLAVVDVDASAWWDRLWTLAETHESPVDEEDPEKFYERVINRPAGKLAEWLLFAIDGEKKRGGVTGADRTRLQKILNSQSIAGELGRGACAFSAGFVLHVDARLALGPLRKAMSTEDLHGRALRATLVRGQQLSFVATRAFRAQLFAALREGKGRESGAAFRASKVLQPLISWRMTPGTGKPPLAPSDVRGLLESAPRVLLAGAAECMRYWLPGVAGNPANAWRMLIGPLFMAVWPNEARFRSSSVSEALAALCAGTGAAFEEAFDMIKHYLSPFDGHWTSVHFLDASSAPTDAPVACLELLWRACGPGAGGRSADLATVLGKIIKAAPALEIDRRVQWLEQNRVIRYD